MVGSRLPALVPPAAPLNKVNALHPGAPPPVGYAFRSKRGASARERYSPSCWRNRGTDSVHDSTGNRTRNSASGSRGWRRARPEAANRREADEAADMKGEWKLASVASILVPRALRFCGDNLLVAPWQRSAQIQPRCPTRPSVRAPITSQTIMRCRQPTSSMTASALRLSLAMAFNYIPAFTLLPV